MEEDRDFDGYMHGRSGPVPIRRQRVEDWPPYCRAVASVAYELGLPAIQDINGVFRDGVARMPIAAASERVSAARAYLTAQVRSRPNLHILPNLHCKRVTFHGLQVTGIEAMRGREVLRLQSPNVMLAAGALQSPAILMRSGVGNPAALAQVGIQAVCESIGVGENLQNHPLLTIGLHLVPGAVQADTAASAAYFCIRQSSVSAFPVHSDLYFSVLNRSAWHYLGRHLATFGVMVHKPFSRGRMRITSSDPLAAPQIDFDFLSDSRDADRLVEGLRFAVSVLADPRIQTLCRGAGLIRPGRLSRMLSRRTLTSRTLDSALAMLLPQVPRLERTLFDRLLGSVLLDDLAHASESRLLSHVHSAVSGVFHAVGTCRMGRTGDPMAVVDSSGGVHGVNGLHVADASIMPTIPRAGTFLPTVMIAEKIADAIAGGGDRRR